MTLMKKNVDSPDETRTPPRARIDVVTVGDLVFGRAVFEPGWRWSESVKPVAKTESCMAHHNGYVISGRIVMRMDDGTEVEAGPGDVFVCPPGHDAWVVGDEPCVALDFAGMGNYAKPA